MLRQQVILGLEMVFRDSSALSSEIKERIADAEGISWEETGVGFFSTVRLKRPLSSVPEISMWDYAFEHPDFPFGGTYNCVIASDNELELEGVTLGGTDWPFPTEKEKFREII